MVKRLGRVEETPRRKLCRGRAVPGTSRGSVARNRHESARRVSGVSGGGGGDRHVRASRGKRDRVRSVDTATERRSALVGR